MNRRSYLWTAIAVAFPLFLLTGCGAGGCVKDAVKCAECKGTGRCQECLTNTYIVKSCPRCKGTHKCGGCVGNGW